MSHKLPRQERKAMGFKESVKFNQKITSKRNRRDDWLFLRRFQADYDSGVLSHEDAIAVLEARLRG